MISAKSGVVGTEVVAKTTHSVANDDKVGTMTALGVQGKINHLVYV